MENFSEFDQLASVPQQNFGDINSHAFKNYFKVIGWGILMFVLASIISAVISSIVAAVMGYDQSEAQTVVRDAMASKDFSGMSSRLMTVHGYKESSGVSYLLNLLLTPLYVGFLYILQKANFGKTVAFSDLFIGFRQNTGQIILYAFLSGLLAIFALGLSALLCFMPFFFIAPFFLIGLPVVFFENTTAMAALKKSFSIAGKNYGTFLGVTVVAILFSVTGALLCGVGVIATFPFIFSAAYSTYCAYCGAPRQIDYQPES